MAIGFMKRMSPEYVLEKALEDIKNSGIEGLKPHLTVGGKKKLETLTMFTGGMGMFGGMGMLGGMGMSGSQSNQENGSLSEISFLFNHVKDCDWTIKDVMKGSESAKGILGFKYEDTMEGSLELSLIKEEKEWKIDSMNMPKFDKFKG